MRGSHPVMKNSDVNIHSFIFIARLGLENEKNLRFMTHSNARSTLSRFIGDRKTYPVAAFYDQLIATSSAGLGVHTESEIQFQNRLISFTYQNQNHLYWEHYYYILDTTI